MVNSMSHNMTSTNSLREELLEACSKNDVVRAQHLLDSVKAPASYEPSTIPRTEDGSTHLSAGELIAAAARSKSERLRIYLSGRFPHAQISDADVFDAIVRGDVAAFAQLLAHDPALVNHELEGSLDTTLSRACIHSQSIDIAYLLLDRGADPNLEHRGLFSPLYWAVKEQRPMELVRRLVKHGADLNDRIALSTAVEQGRAAEIKFFLEQGINPQMQLDSKGSTLMMMAEAKDQQLILHVLKEKQRDGKGSNMRQHCCSVM